MSKSKAPLLEAALLAAGSRGLSREEASKACGIASTALWRYVSIGLAIVAPAANTRDRRLFHRSFAKSAAELAAQAAAYTVERAKHPNITASTARALVAAVLDSGERGMTIEDLRKSTGASKRGIASATPFLREHGIRCVRGGGHLPGRYYAAEHAPTIPRREIALASKKSHKAMKHYSPALRLDTLPKVDPPLVIIDGRTKITIAPRFVDRRFIADPDTVPALFQAHGIGHYLPNDSAIARAYGGAA